MTQSVLFPSLNRVMFTGHLAVVGVKQFTQGMSESTQSPHSPKPVAEHCCEDSILGLGCSQGDADESTVAILLLVYARVKRILPRSTINERYPQ